MYVYALRDVETLQCRYVGVTANPQGRLKNHVSHCHDSNASKKEWIQGSNYKVYMEILQYLDVYPSNRLERETWWILEMLRRGEPITNVVVSPGIKITPNLREAMNTRIGH